MMRLALLLLVVCSGCSRTNVDRHQALKNLKAQASEAGQAVMKEDHARMGELTHPALIEKLGGRDKFVQRLAMIAEQMKGQGIKFISHNVNEPTEIVESSGDLYAIVPFTLDLTGPGGLRINQPSYLIGSSSDAGTTWKFLDGSGVGDDRSKLKMILPRFPDQLQLPPKQAPVIEGK